MRHRLLATAIVLSLATPWVRLGLPVAKAAEDLVFELRPHCEETGTKEIFGGTADIETLIAYNQGRCVTYSVNDPGTLRSPPLKVGDTLDLDLMLMNPNAETIKRIRAWLTYDPDVLEGVSIDLDNAFSIVTPGEADFSPSEGLVKIGAAVAEGRNLRDKVIRVARLKFRVIAAPRGATSPLSFFNQLPDTSGNTFVSSTLEGGENLIKRLLGSLLVSVPAGASNTSGDSSSSQASLNGPDTSGNPSATAASSSNETVSSPAGDPSLTSSSSIPAIVTSSSSSVGVVPVAQAAENSSSATTVPFGLMQVQNVRITTRDTSLMVAWDPLRSPDLKGYYVYYGKQMGRYIHRHSLDKKENSFVIRDREPQQIYYVAIRAVSVGGEESAFSQEVAVRVGEPGSSTSPLLGRNFTGSVAENPVPSSPAVPGESGLPLLTTIALVLAAAAGCLFAIRRQVHLVHPL